MDRTTTAPALPEIDSLWDYGDPAGTEQSFQELLDEAEADQAYRAELLTQIARTHSLRGEFGRSHATLDAAETLLGEGDSRARIRLLLERGRTYNSNKKPDQAAPLFLEAWEMGRRIQEDALAIDAAHMVAIVETPEKALEWNERALGLAEASQEAKARSWQGSLYNNIGWTYHDQGKYPRALDMFQKALAFQEQQGKPGEIRVARWCVARCLRSLGRTEEALTIQLSILAELERAGEEPDGYVHEELAELLRALERPGYPEHAARAHEILSKDDWFVENETDRLARMKELAGR